MRQRGELIDDPRAAERAQREIEQRMGGGVKHSTAMFRVHHYLFFILYFTSEIFTSEKISQVTSF